MDASESRMIGALILLLGISFLAIAVHTNQLNALIDMLKTAFRL